MDQVNEEKQTGSEGATFQVSDRRFWVEDESALEEARIPEEKYPSFVEELKRRTETAERKLKERIAALDEENNAFRERLNRQSERKLLQEKGQFLSGLLEIVDNLERALDSASEPTGLEALKAGIALNLELFLAKLKAAGVEPFDSLHQAFDPAAAEAVEMVPTQDPELDRKVVAVLQKGYRHGEQVLRPAAVQVAYLKVE